MPLITSPATQLDGLPLVTKTRAIRLPAGTGPTVGWTMVDGSGRPVDLTPYATPLPPATPNNPVVQLRANEACGLAGPNPASFTGVVVNPTGGGVQATIDPTLLGVPAIYEAAFGVFDPTGTPAVINTFYLVLEPNLFAPAQQGGLGPPRLDEVRLHLRDSDAAENRLLTNTLFDDADIAFALIKAVQAWNTSLPPVAIFDTSTFPRDLRLPWIEGACAQLQYTAADWYAKNYLEVQGAGGVAVADMDRAAVLSQAADRRWQRYLDWVRQQKIAINVSRGFGRLSSPYRIIGWSSIMNS